MMRLHAMGLAPVNESLAEQSDLAISIALILYTASMILFGVWIAKNQRKIEMTNDTEVLVATAGGVKGEKDVRAKGSGITPPSQRVRAGRGDVVTREKGGIAGIAISIFALSFVVHAAGTLMRSLATSRVPWGNMYEYALTGTLLLSLASVVLLFRPSVLGLPNVRSTAWLGVFVAGINVLVLSMALKYWYVPAAQLVPALQNKLWLGIHVFSAIVSSVFFTLGFTCTVLYLMSTSKLTSKSMAKIRSLLPDAATLELAAHRLYIVAFPLWTFVLISGAIWAQDAWGRYWAWDPKETFAFVTWAFYAAYLHARATGGWSRRASWIAVAAFGAYIFGFVVVNQLFSSLHSYSGLD